jgi:peptidoglycan/LPS O-acetylase OafA/YrhL
MAIGLAESEVRSDEPKLAYMPALDGIRGVAIIVIMGYHGGVFLTRGGFYSLDTFFALSGFLITSLLVSEWQRTGTVRLRVFWARRARRLLPGLLCMLLGVACFAAFLVPTGMYPTLRGDGIASLFYYANWHFIASGSNYFIQTGLTSPLIHMWSLAVEEQFYLLWPLIVLATLALTRSRLVLLCICVAGALASAIEMGLLYSVADVNRVYFGTDTRAQSLLVGAALAVGLSLWADRRRGMTHVVPIEGRPFGVQTPWAVRTPQGRLAVLFVGVTGVVGSVALWTTVSYNTAFAYRGGFLLAALGTCGVLCSVVCAPGALLAMGLSWAPLRYIGRISYGMYLWHYPLFTYIDGARTGLTGYPLFLVRAAATVAIATVSYVVVELPIRRGSLRAGWAVRLLVPITVLGTVISLIAATPAPSLSIGAAAPTSTPSGPPVRVLMVGDSTALTLDIGLNEHAASFGVTPFNGGIFGCGVTTGAEYQLKGVDAAMAPECSGSPPAFQWPNLWRYRINEVRPNVVMILAGRWEVVNRTYEGRWTSIADPTYAAYVERELELAVHVAGSDGAQVVLLTAPCYDSGEQPDGEPWPEDSRDRLAIYNSLVRRAASAIPGTALINFNAMSCPGGLYRASMDGQQVRQSDGVHFTFTGGNVFAARIWPQVVALGRAQMARTAPATTPTLH